QRIIVAVEAFGEEHVARHLTGNRSMHLLHLLFDQRVPGLPHDRHATRGADGHRERLRRLHVEDDRLARACSSEYLPPVEYEHISASRYRYPAVNYAYAIRIAITPDPEIGFSVADFSYYVLEIFYDGGIRVMIRERPVGLTE